MHVSGMEFLHLEISTDDHNSGFDQVIFQHTCVYAASFVYLNPIHSLISNEVTEWVYEFFLSYSSLIYPFFSFVKSNITQRKYFNLAYTSVKGNPSVPELCLRLDITLYL
jgi:hypothetical protein